MAVRPLYSRGGSHRSGTGPRVPGRWGCGPLTAEDRSLNPADLLWCVIVFGHGAGVPAGIERVSEALEDAMPALVRRPCRGAGGAVGRSRGRRALVRSHIECLFRPSSPRAELTDELYAWALVRRDPCGDPRGPAGWSTKSRPVVSPRPRAGSESAAKFGGPARRRVAHVGVAVRRRGRTPGYPASRALI